MSKPERLISSARLGPEKGIHWSKSHRIRLIRKNIFPRPVRIGGRDYWVESELDAYIDKLKQERDERVKQLLPQTKVISHHRA